MVVEVEVSRERLRTWHPKVARHCQTGRAMGESHGGEPEGRCAGKTHETRIDSRGGRPMKKNSEASLKIMIS